MELMLLSNSTNHGGAMFHHAAKALIEVTGGDTVTFVPYALDDWDDYADRVADALQALDIDAVAAHRARDPHRAILDAEVVLMGGGNSFLLLDALHRLDVISGLGERVRAGSTRYLGSSAGTNVACPTIRTTNDMPIREPPSFAAIGLVPFQINPHYVDTDPTSTFMGESRDDRLEESLQENDCPVLALYEGSWLRVSGEVVTVRGPARLFRRDGVRDLADGADVSHLLAVSGSVGTGRRPGRPNAP